PADRGQVGLFLVCFGLVLSLPELASPFFQLLKSSTNNQLGTANAAQILVALGTLFLVGWFIARRRTIKHLAVALGLLFAINASLLAIVWLIERYSEETPRVTFTLTQALLVMGAFLWDLLTSGEQITNRDGPRFPRY